MSGDGFDEAFRGAPLHMAEFSLLERLEIGMPRCRFRATRPPTAHPATGDLRKLSHPGHRIVIVVPQRYEHASGFEHPGDLGHCGLDVEPMKGLTGENRVHQRSWQRNPFGAA